MQPEEKRIIKLKYSAERFCNLGETEIKLSATKLLLVISVVTGWQLPSDPIHLNILKDNFEKKLVEGYGSMNYGEFEYSLRNYPVKDWGKFINLNLIDEVVEQYIEKRLELSRIEENLNRPKELPPNKEAIDDEEFLEINKSIFYTMGAYGHISCRCYDILVAKGEIKLSEEEKVAIRQSVKSTLSMDEDFTKFTESKKERLISQNSKRMACAGYFNSVKPDEKHLP